jgi:hypothetical protein
MEFSFLIMNGINYLLISGLSRKSERAVETATAAAAGAVFNRRILSRRV